MSDFYNEIMAELGNPDGKLPQNLLAQVQEKMRLLFGQPEISASIFPYPCVIPEYREFTKGPWQLRHVPDFPHKSYFSGLMRMGMEPPVLMKNGAPWMGVTARECESHLFHVWAAEESYNTAVVGLGMGYYPYQLVHNGVGGEITVFEIDQNVTDLFYESTKGNARWDEVHECLKVEHHNLLTTPYTKAQYDHCYVDIWETLAETSAEEDTANVCKNLAAGTYSFWTQEVCYISWLADHNKDMEPHTLEEYFATILPSRPSAFGLPHDMEVDDYIALCKEAAVRAFLD